MYYYICPNITSDLVIDPYARLTMTVRRCGTAIGDEYAKDIECSGNMIRRNFQMVFYLVSTYFDPQYYEKHGRYKLLSERSWDYIGVNYTQTWNANVNTNNVNEYHNSFF